jgi:hypothetical protein
MGNQMSLEENDEIENNEMKVIEKNDSENIESNQGQCGNGGGVNKKIKKNMQDQKGGLVKKRRSTSKSGANLNTLKKTRNNRRR